MKISEVVLKSNEGKIFIDRKGNEYTIEVRKSFLDDEVVLVDKLGTPVKITSDILFEDFLLCEKNNPWSRVRKGENYYFTNGTGIDYYIFSDDATDNEIFDNCNYFSNKDKAIEVFKSQLLYRKMLKFRDENDERVDWRNEVVQGYRIYWSVIDKVYKVSPNEITRNLHDVYFTTRELAERCMKEIVKPFFKEEN